MKNMKKLDRKTKAALAANDYAALRSAGYSASELRSAGYSASELRSAGYSASELRSAGYSLSELRSAGYSLSDLRIAGYPLSALISAGYPLSDLISAGYPLSDLREFESIPVIKNPYSQLLADINNKKRTHQQSTFGPESCPPESEVCGTHMCTAGHLVHMAYLAGWDEAYDSVKKNGWATTAGMIHYRAHPDKPCQNFANIPQDWAMAYIEEMAEMEQTKK